MGREADLAKLRDLQQDIYDMYEHAEHCEHISKRINSLISEKNAQVKPKYTVDPVNNYDTLKKQYDEKWLKRHRNMTFYKVIIGLACFLANAAVCYILFSDVFRNTGYIVSPEMVAQIESHNDKISIFVSQIVLSIICTIVPISLFGKES